MSETNLSERPLFTYEIERPFHLKDAPNHPLHKLFMISSEPPCYSTSSNPMPKNARRTKKSKLCI
jgi:hypothetical protein